jgi:hypothetical protein
MTQQQFTAPITYFLQEGRENLEECLKIAFQGAKQHSITTIVIFTARGEGVKVAVERFQNQPEYSSIRLVAVTFPQGKQFTDANNAPITVEISKEDRDEFRRRNIPIVRAHLPFDPITPIVWQTGTLGTGSQSCRERVGDVRRKHEPMYPGCSCGLRCWRNRTWGTCRRADFGYGNSCPSNIHAKDALGVDSPGNFVQASDS